MIGDFEFSYHDDDDDDRSRVRNVAVYQFAVNFFSALTNFLHCIGSAVCLCRRSTKGGRRSGAPLTRDEVAIINDTRHDIAFDRNGRNSWPGRSVGCAWHFEFRSEGEACQSVVLAPQ